MNKYSCINKCGATNHIKNIFCSDCMSKKKQENKEILVCGTCVSTIDLCKCKSSTGSARHNQGKVQLREVDPDFIIGLGEVLTASREKYDEGNWMKETKFSTPYESAMRHLMKFWSGDELDEETSKHHLLHAATNLMFLYYHTRSGVGIDDRLFKKEKKK